jgi:quinol monooxygenase YgiN
MGPQRRYFGFQFFLKANAMIHVVAIITAVPGARERVLEAFRANRPTVLQEEGCIEYNATVDAAEPAKGWAAFGPDTIVIIEKWASRDALKAHAAAPHMLAYGAKVKDFVANRAIHVLDPAE